MINLKDNIWIENFNTYGGYASRMDVIDSDELRYELMYAGKVLEITEEFAKELVIQHGIEKGEQIEEHIVEEDVLFGFKNYKEGFGILEYNTAIESIQSACDKPYCIIYKRINN